VAVVALVGANALAEALAVQGVDHEMLNVTNFVKV
jgi:hypothetical protein